MADAAPTFGIDLYRLPLGASGHFVRLSGRAFEAVVATIGRRARRDLYHSALEVRVPEGRYTIEMTPVPDADVARTLLDVMPRVPMSTWGRDELHAGEMWNSNSLTAWLLVRSDLDLDAITLPPNGRAPGWNAGKVVAQRQIRAHA